MKKEYQITYMGKAVGSNQHKTRLKASSRVTRLYTASKRAFLILALFITVQYAYGLLMRHALPSEYDLVAITTDYFEEVFVKPVFTGTFTLPAKADEIDEDIDLETLPEVLQKILAAESGGRQFCTARDVQQFKDSRSTWRCQCDRVGEPLMCTNTNASVDVGIGQLNSVQLTAAAKMGLNVKYDRNDNIRYVVHLYETEGTRPWYSSERLWSKMTIEQAQAINRKNN